MKRLLSVAVMVLVTLVGMVGVRSAAGQNESDVITQLQNIQQTLSAVSYYYTVSELQSTANPTNEAVTELLETVNAGVPVKPKMYYLTRNSFDGGDAIKACDPRFHMASISEIKDPSNLQYATRSTPAYDAPPYDQVFGPPSDDMGYIGWVRTGSFPIEGGPDYCDYSMSSFDHQRGTTLVLHTQLWGDPYNNLYQSYTETESQKRPNNHHFTHPQHVWCIEDPV